MQISQHDPLGVTIAGVELDMLSVEEIDVLRDLLADHGVVVIPEQRVDDDTFADFLRRLGPLAFTEGETPVDGRDDLNVISNVGRASAPKSNFHVDTSYIREPPAYTALRAVKVPERGGATVFTNQYLALATLPQNLREQIELRVITHVMTGLDLDADAETSADHPVIRPHPRTGRAALYLSTAARCAGVSGLADADAAELVAELLRHSTQPANTFIHTWKEGDVVVWDNACVLHKGDHSRVVGDRVMHRGMVAAAGHTASPGRQ